MDRGRYPFPITRDVVSYPPQAPKNYELSSRIVLTAIVILFIIVFTILSLHIYVRCFLLRNRRNQLRRARRQNSRLVLDPSVSQGLDASVLTSLPVFVFSSKTHQEAQECAVCLSEFEENDKGRLLPKCKHSFHIDCIDMWFHSHSTCPLCRAPVKPESSTPSPSVPQNRGEIVVAIESEWDSEVGSSSGFCSSCRHGEETEHSSSSPSGSSSLDSGSSSSSSGLCSSSSFRKKALGFVGMGIEVPTRRIGSFRGSEELEIMVVSPGGQALKSPGSRLLSFKRILGRDMKSPGTRADVFSICSSVREIDPERGEEQHPQTQS